MDLYYLNSNKIKVNKWIANYFQKKQMTSSLDRAIKYGVKNGGKRLRPYFIIQLSKILNIPLTSYKKIALAVEFIHCYSLIHDDLPAMDNDDYRRGKLTVHKKFNESTAILAGNSLFGLAIELILDIKFYNNSDLKSKILGLVLDYSGPNGLMLGQYNDLYFENKNTSVHKILSTYKLKTSKLFQLSLMLPFMLAKSNNRDIKKAKIFGENFGIIYQIADDFSDSNRSFKETGKIPGKDIKKGKRTLISKIGRAQALDLCYRLAEEATKDKTIFGNDKYNFKKMIFNIVEGIKIK